MKKHLFSITVPVILAAFILSACGSSSPVASGENSTASAESVSEAAPEEEEITTQGTGLCANEFFPLRNDKTWKYTITSGDTTGDYSLTFKDITATSFTTVQTFSSDVTNEVNWQCDENGMISSTFANMSFVSSSDISIDTLDVSGVTLPHAEEWTIGKVWDSLYTVEVTINSGGTEIQAQGTIDISNEIASSESVTVPAGTYDNAYRVDSTGEMTIDLMGTKTSMSLIYSTWYIKGLGIVKSSSTDANTPYEMVLVSFE
jgi:hypothetical protein